MKEFIAENGKKIVILELDRGDKVIESIETKLSELGIGNAVIISAVGSIQRLRFHWPTTLGEAANDEFFDLEAPFEFGSLTGSVIDGCAHFHFSAFGQQGVYGGHLEYGTEVLYLLEVTLMELSGLSLKRDLTPENVKRLFPL